MLDRQMKFLLRIGATIYALVALVALVKPSTVAEIVGLPLDFDPDVILWSVRVSGALLLPLAGFMALAAAFFPERALRQSGALMVAFTFLAEALLVVAPGPWEWGRALFLVVGALFIALFGKALRARVRHR